MVENSETSVQSGRRSTRGVLSVNDKLEILQQAVLNLASSGISAQVTPLHTRGTRSVAIVLDGVEIQGGRLVAITGTEVPA